MSEPLAPVAVQDRIAALDVIRGFALLGIFMMNVEFFNRPMAELDLGLPAGVGGIDGWAGWFVHVFVRGKFWTMFSLLFGIGFAVMLARAEAAGRSFTGPYLRRTLALGVIGALHAILVWGGDILFTYAAAAMGLMAALHLRPRAVLGLAAASGALAFGLKTLLGTGHAVAPWQLWANLAVCLVVLAVVAWALRRWPARGMRNTGLALYLVPFLLMALGGAMMMRQPAPPTVAAATQGHGAPPAAADARAKEIARRKAEQQKEVVEETRVERSGTYAQVVGFRASVFLEHQAREVPFWLIVIGMFLLGAWFVRSGIMLRPQDHLPLFRKLAWVGLPVGLGLSLVSASIATGHAWGVNDGPFQFALALLMLANLPACLGYVALLVLGLHGPLRRLLGLLAPAGRMALTNYLAQNILGTFFFYGYGLAHWGMGRAQQLVFVVVVFALQVAFSHWWLARFRYGPMEWLWRSVTYLRKPSMRVERLQPA